jgi:hypothetical protein
MGEAENELRDVPRRIALERVPTIALRRDSLVFPYVDAHVQRRTRGNASLPAPAEWLGPIISTVQHGKLPTRCVARRLEPSDKVRLP